MYIITVVKKSGARKNGSTKRIWKNSVVRKVN